MLKSFSKILILLIILGFSFQITSYYFSEKNISSTNNNNFNINNELDKKISDLRVLKNDTNNVIEFNNGFNNNNTKPKRKFWDLMTN
ncbi:MAG: hypothetical protein CBE47_00515 [Pelagibacteraceae bacterium TMED287]|nr:MAG: hypothetical protein CBE47_00515 [Pelagibacteraceae bacterium TMED287]|tara:strand:- start:2166 stop:2426 length:261 start_codon:yes stop_codon:yes gene_type:complete